MSPRIYRVIEVCGLWKWYRLQVAENLGVELVWERRKATRVRKHFVSTRYDTVFVMSEEAEVEEEKGKENGKCWQECQCGHGIGAKFYFKTFSYCESGGVASGVRTHFLPWF
jgi:hypothetical protein